MGIFDWFKALSKDDNKPSVPAAAPLAGSINENAVINGLDFVAAIEAHRKWKERLTAYTLGTSTEKLDHSVICRDDQCALGKWIYGNGMTLTGHLPIFHQLKDKHAQFHISAAQVVEQVQHNQHESAISLLKEGAFSKNSRDVQRLISKLYIEITGK